MHRTVQQHAFATRLSSCPEFRPLLNALISSPAVCGILRARKIRMICPNCNSTNLKSLALIHAAGLYQSSGRTWGLLFGVGDGLYFGSYKGSSQSLLSKVAAPPRKGLYAGPTILWLMGFFVVMAFAGRGKLSTPMALFSVAYVLTLPTLLIGTFVYNFFVRPRKLRHWQHQSTYQSCGAITEGMINRQYVPAVRHPGGA
jgi:hypothetical protein